MILRSTTLWSAAVTMRAHVVHLCEEALDPNRPNARAGRKRKTEERVSGSGSGFRVRVQGSGFGVRGSVFHAVRFHLVPKLELGNQRGSWSLGTRGSWSLGTRGEGGAWNQRGAWNHDYSVFRASFETVRWKGRWRNEIAAHPVYG